MSWELTSSNCPYCPGPSRSWAMGPEGWENMRRDHEANHGQPDPRDATIAQLREELAHKWDADWLLRTLSDTERQRDSLAASLEAKDAEMSKLSARIYAASSALRSELTLHCGSENVLTDGMKYALAILSPPEGPK